MRLLLRGIQSIDSGSTSSIFEISAKPSVNAKPLTGALGLAVGTLLVGWQHPLIIYIASTLLANWWALSVSASLTSVALLAGALLLRTKRTSRARAHLASEAYLTSALTAAVANVAPLFESATAPPYWLGVTTTCLLFASAFLYYKASAPESNALRSEGHRRLMSQ